MNKVRLILLTALCLFTSTVVMADDNPKQAFNPLETGVPSLTIAPDARGGGMGDVGAATDPDVFSQYWNPAKYAFAYSKAGAALSYTPWLRKLVDDIDLMYLAGFYKLGSNDNQALAFSLRYFSLGEINLTGSGSGGYDLGSVKPYEMAVDISYSLKFSETFSGAAAIRYIRSDLGTSEDGITPGTSVAADIAGYYNNYVMLGASECLWGLGFNISNIGNKISYDDGNNKTFLPTNLRIGTSLLYPMDDYNTIAFSVDLNKLLVPTPPDLTGLSDDEQQIKRDEYNEISPISGIFKSFSDAPGGFSEELEEITWSVGAEYAYDNQFFVRGGYFHEHERKGNRKYFSLGAGFKMTAFQLDVAYLISTVTSNPLDQTLRFSLSFDMDGLAGLMK
ncbi:type IX secretion system outer membrane channel protein PorV [Bacteroidales bacterium OttesenSCG-928-M11]|nr:type IX secretion system outer membrane channel protein PorV [Bacteroidales bacterium OttesenSCG-928-M11]